MISHRSNFNNLKLEYLQSKGHKVVELRKAKNWNNVELIVNEHRVFKCKMNDLDFGGDGELDSLVIQAEESVRNAY